MAASKLAAKYNVNVMRHGLTRRDRKYHAFRGGNGTGEPVVSIAEAYTLAGLDCYLAKKVARGALSVNSNAAESK